ncbi:unnamed protein product [Heligmosomoides polygyrus]|uniref:Reverse transcriptase domain-containing protein n=1 Tax=Heligmosomoides polygyrus TaxID=6339 RepID=A0A183FVG6_HELPZ|nr:unnamed protein product [Heligmosomoides polygyrus]
MKDLNWDDKGYLVDGKRISKLRFADDIVLISTSTAEVEEMLNELNVAGMSQRYCSHLYQHGRSRGNAERAQCGSTSTTTSTSRRMLLETSTTIQLFDRKLKIPIGKGIRQRDTISPKLFTAALQDAMKDLNWDDKGYLVDGKRISKLRFADDIVLISTSTAEVEEMLNELNVAGMKIGLDMNMSKTQFMVNQWCDTGPVR